MRGAERIAAVLLLAFCLLAGAAAAARADEGVVFDRWGQKYGAGYTLPWDNFHGASKPFVDASGKDCAGCHDNSNYPGHDFFKAENSTKETVMWTAFALTIFLFIMGILGKFSIWEIGRKPSLHQRIDKGAVARASVLDVFLGKKIYRQSRLRWFIYLTISWGFILLFLSALFLVIMRFVLDVPFFIIGPGSLALDFICDLLGLAVLVGVITAMIRRYVIRPELLDTTFEDSAILVSLLLIVLSGFFLEALRIAALPPEPALEWSFVGYILSIPLRGTGLSVHWYLWIFHVVLSFGFIMFMPYNKIAHFIAGPLSILSTVSEEAHYTERVRHRDVRGYNPRD